ncbi:MAG: hypothetical protein ABI847_20580 [Anaerolineales bacterium]
MHIILFLQRRFPQHQGAIIATALALSVAGLALGVGVLLMK